MKKKRRLQSGVSWSSSRLFEGSCGQHLAWSNSCAECVNVSLSKKMEPDRSWQMWRVSGKMEQPAGGSTDLRFEGVLMRRAYCSEKSGDWANYLEAFLGNGKLSMWASSKVRECYSEVEQEDEGRLCIAHDILDSCGRIIAPVDEQGGITLSYVCPQCHCFLLEDHMCWVSSGMERGSADGVRLVAARTSGKPRTVSWSYKMT